MRTMNKQEQRALAMLFARKYGAVYDSNKALLRHYRAFRRTVFYTYMGCWIVPNWCGMTIGIERDGYTHS